MSRAVLLDCTISEELARCVEARNNKAALFGTLETLAKIEGCTAVYWGLQSDSQKHLWLVAGFEGPLKRFKLPLDRLSPFLAAPPRILEAVRLYDLCSLDSSIEVTIHLTRSSITHGYQLQEQPSDTPSGHEKTLLNSNADGEGWVDFQAAKWTGDVRFTFECKKPFDWLEAMKRIIPYMADPPRSPFLSAEQIDLTMIPHKFSMPSTTSYYRYLEAMKSSTNVESVTEIFKRMKAEETANEDGWVLVNEAV
ncbi:hypothetical protein M409DRAFT_51732 [Zasmidium cellare ATCC 36951]|uniref:Uncharacterized protein n=1 Tax=Zasmidium cellare ATCC 36951 TaxID=1080233 RepID=A0A6A6CS93_ZASCE|nr:uncharacterized protein M409DRAFT_51732 [Zasmidium cellare ATCC 36951]KAF2169945.1 hypothetical protein M409DRAFT_51732 [Zasmidium cellare ATCC 36951]